MTPALMDRAIAPAEQPELADGVTLEELLSATLHAARANGSTECPVCHARMVYTRVGASGTTAVPAAECGGCASRLT